MDLKAAGITPPSAAPATVGLGPAAGAAGRGTGAPVSSSPATDAAQTAKLAEMATQIRSILDTDTGAGAGTRAVDPKATDALIRTVLGDATYDSLTSPAGRASVAAQTGDVGTVLQAMLRVIDAANPTPVESGVESKGDALAASLAGVFDAESLPVVNSAAA